MLFRDPAIDRDETIYGKRRYETISERLLLPKLAA